MEEMLADGEAMRGRANALFKAGRIGRARQARTFGFFCGLFW